MNIVGLCPILKNVLTQQVNINDSISDSNNITSGVPQGSILGPLLFLIYINDLAFLSDKIYSLLYADDTSMFISGPKIHQIQNVMNEHLQIVSDWLKANKLSLNVGKTNYMVFANKEFNAEEMVITIEGTSISITKSTKFLGVFIDDKLT